MKDNSIVVLVSASGEWQVVLNHYAPPVADSTPFGEWFESEIKGYPVLFVRGGWGKISAAASTQYAIDRWKPKLVINLGTCGGLEGRVSRGELLLAEQTLVYDIIEQMSDPEDAIKAYAVDVDLSWLKPPYPLEVRRVRMLSADRDILAEDVARLITDYNAVAADWESGAIAWVAKQNQVHCLILRGVSDLVGVEGGEAYGNHAFFVAGTHEVMTRLINSLPGWLSCIEQRDFVVKK